MHYYQNASFSGNTGLEQQYHLLIPQVSTRLAQIAGMCKNTAHSSFGTLDKLLHQTLPFSTHKCDRSPRQGHYGNPILSRYHPPDSVTSHLCWAWFRGPADENTKCFPGRQQNLGHQEDMTKLDYVVWPWTIPTHATQAPGPDRVIADGFQKRARQS